MNFSWTRQNFKNKKGVAILTVLLFMLMATIAATAVYKWVASEERVSASRLKQNEAYQASQSGLNVARAWMAFNGNEIGAIISQFQADPSHHRILLDSMIVPMESVMRQRFSVSLTDVSVVNENTVHVKLISQGFGRDGSTYSQVGIFTIDGLYQVDLPAEANNINYNFAYFGGSTSYSGEHTATSMLINGNWEGNPGVVEKDFIVTGNVNLSGSNITIKENACIGGDLNADNKYTGASIYVDGDVYNANAVINGDAYFNGNVVAGGTEDVVVAGNATVNGTFTANSAHNVTFQKNLCLGPDGRVVLDNTGGKKFQVTKNVWFPNEGSVSGNISLANSGNMYQILGANPESQMYIANSYIDSVKGDLYYLHQEGDFFSSVWGWISGDYNWRHFVTYAQTRSSLVSGKAPFDCGDTVKAYCEKKWKAAAGCDGSSYFIEDLLTTSYESFKTFANSATCSMNITSIGPSTVNDLNACYASLVERDDRDDFLYKGFLVVRLSYGGKSDPSGDLAGKFIFIYDDVLGQQEMPATNDTSVVMLYLKKGTNGELMQGAGKHNYFIYTEGDIQSLMGTNWNGSIYAVAKNCAKAGNFNGNVGLTYDENLVKKLTDAGVICNAGNSCLGPVKGGGGTTTDPSTGETVTGPTTKDSHWIALAPTLKVTLNSQYTNREYLSADSTYPEKGLLVMPRIIYLETGHSLVDGGAKHYNVMYLGGLEPSESGSASCDMGAVFKGGAIGETGTFDKAGVYTCVYSEGDYSSNFWVWVDQKGSSSKVYFDQAQVKADDLEECSTPIPIYIRKEGNSAGGHLKVMVYHNVAGASYYPNPSTTGQFTLTGSGQEYDLVIADNASLAEPIFYVKFDGYCSSATGYIQFQLLDGDDTDKMRIGDPGNEMVRFGNGSGMVAHKSIDESPDVLDFDKNRPNCTVVTDADADWSIVKADNKPGCNEVETPVNSNYGPWQCTLGSDVVIKSAKKDLYESACELVTSRDVYMVESVSETTFVYASLKKKMLNLHLEISFGKGSASVKPDPDGDVKLYLYDKTDALVGECSVVGSGCDFITFYGDTYYAVAKGHDFSKWNYACASKGSKTEKDCGISGGLGNKTIAITMYENDSLFADFNKQGYCFTENFKNLHHYCDPEVLPVVLGDSWGANAGKGIGGFAFGTWSGFRNTKAPNNTLEKQAKMLGDFAHGEIGENGEPQRCIDQCVSTPAYRYSQYGGDRGRRYVFYKNTNCSVEGVERKIIGESYKDLSSEEKKLAWERNSDIASYDSKSVAYKELQANGFWSYGDFGVSCEQWADSTTKNDGKWWFPDAVKIDGTVEHLANYSVSGNAGKGCANIRTESLDSLWSYRFVKQTGDVTKRVNRDYEHIKDIINTVGAAKYETHYDGIAPRSLSTKMTGGGYYSQFDENSPWMRVSMGGISQQARHGATALSSTEFLPVVSNDASIYAEYLANDYVVPDYEARKALNWNIKPYINREGAGYLTTATGDTKWGFGVLRKHPAGYDGTYSKIFTLNATGVASDGGKTTSLVLRSNADMSNFFLLNLDPTSSSPDAHHIFLCHCQDELCYVRFSQTTQSNKNQTEAMNKYTISHCITEAQALDADVSAAFNNYTWSTIKKYPLQVTAEMTDNIMEVKVYYTSKANDAWDRLDGAKGIYLKAKFDLRDYKKFGYNEEYNPIAEMNETENVYVGFTMNNPDEIVYNLEWRSGSCTESATSATVFCGFENPDVQSGSKDLPIRYVYDFCPDGGDCHCTYEYSFDYGNTWIPESNFEVPTAKDAAKYPTGRMKIRASCEDYNDPSRNKIMEESCDGFTIRNNQEDKCYDNYTLFSNGGQFSYNTYLPGSSVLLDNEHYSKISAYMSSDEVAIREHLCQDDDGTSHYSATQYCSNKNASTHNINSVDFHPKENNKTKNSDLNGNSLIRTDTTTASGPDEIVDSYIQLVDSVGSEGTKMNLNLNMSNLEMRMYQTTLADSIWIWLEDENGRRSGSYTLQNTRINLNERGDYCGVNDDYTGIPKATYEANPTAYPDHYQELCHHDLVWVRDVKRFKRAANWATLYPWIDLKINFESFLNDAHPDFDFTKVSKIHFSQKNSRGGGLHFENIKVVCNYRIDVKDCIADHIDANKTTVRTSPENDQTINVDAGQWIYYRFNAPGASQCIMRMLPQNATDTTYSYIAGFEQYTDDWFSCSDVMSLDTIVPTCSAADNVGTCKGRIYIVAKNASDELDSCAGTDNRFKYKNLNVNKMTYTCYDFTSEPVTFTGDSVSMGVSFSSLKPKPLSVSLYSPSGKLIETKMVTDSYTNKDLQYQTCHVNSAGLETKVTKYNANGTIYSWNNAFTKCAYFTFKPEETGDYKIVYGTGEATVCTRTVEVPQPELYDCVIPEIPKNDASIVISASGKNLQNKGKITVGSAEDDCTFNASEGVVACGIDIPKRSGIYPISISFDGVKPLSCGNLNISALPTAYNYKVDCAGRFVTKVNNPSEELYYYKLSMCEDLMGNGCSVVVQDSGIATSLMLQTYPEAGHRYMYVFELSNKKDFDPKTTVGDYEWNCSGEDIDAECYFYNPTVGAKSTATFVVKGASGVTDLYGTEATLYNGTTPIGNVRIPSDGTGAELQFTAPVTPGSFLYELKKDDKTICSSTLHIAPVSATCSFQQAMEWPNTTVDKVMSKLNQYGQWKPMEVNFVASDIQNISGQVNARLTCNDVPGEKAMTLSEYNPVSSVKFPVPDRTVDVVCTLKDESGDEICSSTLSVAKTELESEGCKVANDDGKLGQSVGIWTYKRLQGTHFYFYYKNSEITSFKVYSYNWFDVQEDTYSSYELGCSGHESSGYDCVTVYPKVETCLSKGKWVDCGYVAGTYTYRMCGTRNDYFGNTETCCDAKVSMYN